MLQWNNKLETLKNIWLNVYILTYDFHFIYHDSVKKKKNNQQLSNIIIYIFLYHDISAFSDLRSVSFELEVIKPLHLLWLHIILKDCIYLIFRFHFYPSLAHFYMRNIHLQVKTEWSRCTHAYYKEIVICWTNCLSIVCACWYLVGNILEFSVDWNW